jgi:hypothetical protein
MIFLTIFSSIKLPVQNEGPMHFLSYFPFQNTSSSNISTALAANRTKNRFLYPIDEIGTSAGEGSSMHLGHLPLAWPMLSFFCS